MIKLVWVLSLVLALTSADALAQEGVDSVSGEIQLESDKESQVVAQNRRTRARTPRRSSSGLGQALQLAKSGKYQEASIQLFQLSYSPRYRSRRMQIKYILGLMLYQMKLNQVAAFQFIAVVKDGNNRYLNQALEKLSLAADTLGDDTLLNYAISRVKVEQFPRVHRDMLAFRIGEYQLRNKQYAPAARNFSRVQRNSNLFPKAKYMEGLAYAEANAARRAVAAFDELIQARSGSGVTDSARVAGLMGRARSLYQMKQWDGAIDTYREVPRDTEFWHDTLFESSWAMLRSGRFRSALSNFHSLHSSYYEDAYLPESLLLRAIVYLYICKYDEMEKVLNLFDRLYKPVYKGIDNVLESYRDPVQYFNEVVRVVIDYKKHGDDLDKSKYNIPFLVVRRILKEGDFQTSYNYIKKLLDEKRALQAMPPQWRASALGKYSQKVVDTRLLKARQRAGRQIRFHLESLKEEMVDLFEQEGFIRYEMINGKKESLKKKIAGKDLPDEQIDQDSSRDYYVQNGFEYWPFRGEYWLDELGNYHYVGTQSCE